MIAILALFAAGCGGPTSSDDAPQPLSPSAPPPSSDSIKCEGEGCEYDGKEIKTTPCAEPAVDASKDRVSAEALGIKAEVVVRKSAASGLACDRLYWAKLDMSRFANAPNQQPYVLSLTVQSGVSSHTVTQRSDNPSLEALTRTIKVSESMLGQGLTMTACVEVERSVDQVCTAAEVV